MTLQNKIYWIFCAVLVLLCFWVGGAFGNVTIPPNLSWSYASTSFLINNSTTPGRIDAAGPKTALQGEFNPATARAGYFLYVDGNHYTETSSCHHYCTTWNNFNKVSGCTYCGGSASGRIAADFSQDYGQYLTNYTSYLGISASLCPQADPLNTTYLFFYCAELSGANKCYYSEFKKTGWDSARSACILELLPAYAAVPELNILSPTNNAEISTGTDTLNIDFINYTHRRFDIYFENNFLNQSSSVTIFTGTDADYNFSSALSAFDFNVDGNWALVVKEYDESGTLLNTLYDGVATGDFILNIQFSGISPILYCAQYDGNEAACSARTPACVYSSITSLCLGVIPTNPQYPSEQNFNDWYVLNSSGEYATPTPLAAAIGGFLYNVFNSFGDTFGSLLNNFNTADAFAQGENLGLIFPKSLAYLDNLSFFIGGFPMSTIFKILIIAVLAVVVIKIIFKFIPFFG